MNAYKKVISASRRTDLVGCYPDLLVEKLGQFLPEEIHTIVIWTKNPENIIRHKTLKEKIKKFKQIFVHLTITGMGGTELEPGIPDKKEVLKQLPELIKSVSNPQRITWRFDPIIRLKKNGNIFTNLIHFDYLLNEISKTGIKTCRTSWVFPYKKVCSRIEKLGFELVLPDYSMMHEDCSILEKKLKAKNMELNVCAVEGFRRSSCIDGKLLSELHPENEPCSVKKAVGQRKLCGCTESFDIGSYGLKCPHGCIYCYANPAVK